MQKQIINPVGTWKTWSANKKEALAAVKNKQNEK